MKQFTFSAQVANNLLNVLQGYTKSIRFVAILTMLLTVGIGSAWGATDVILWNGADPSYQASTTEKTSTDGAIKWKNSAGNTYSNPTRIYSGNTLTISVANTATTKITKIVAVCTTDAYASAFGGTSVDVTGGGTASRSVSGSTTTITITGKATSVAMKMSAQSRVSKLTVTYETAVSYTVNWTINPAAGGTLSATSGNSTTVSPNAAYTYGAPAYTVTSGAATVSQSGNTFTATPTANSTIQINMVEKPKYTVTLVPGSGSVTNTELEEPNAGAGVTLPTPTLDCGDWEFAGWKTTSAVTTETTTEPTLIPAGAYSPTSDITLYAVYQRTVTTSGGGGGSTEVTFNFGYTDWGKAASFSGTTYSTVEQNKNGVSVTYTRNDGSLYANTTSLRLYKTNTLTFDAGSNTITSITFTGNIGQSDITTDAGTCTNSTNTLSWAGSSKSVTFTRPSNASSYATLTSATLTIGGGSTTYYHSTPDCGSTGPSQLATPTGLNVTNITSTSATLSWGEVANASSYTVFITDLDDEEITLTDIEEVSVDVTGLSPETLYLWDVVAIGDGANYTDSEHSSQEDPNAEFTTSAAASPATITLSQLGVTSTIDTYSVGDQYTLPTTSSQSCDGKQLVGWSTVEVAETDTKPTSNYYELGAEVTLAETQTFYAVFAAGSGGGGETWTLVKDVNDLAVGDEIVIAASGSDYALSTTQNSNNRGQAAVTKNGETITFGNDVQVLTLQTGNVSNSFAFYTGSGYLYAASSSKNYLRTETNLSDNSSWSIAITNAGVATITAQGTNTNNWLRYNSSSSIFSCYNSGQADVSIYKKAGGGGYTAYSTSCIPTYSITYDFAGGTGSHCSNTSVPQGDTYTICDEAPTKEGYTFQGWLDGTSTYAAGATITPTKNTTLTAVWQPNTYTVIWSNNGTPNPVEYNHGVALVVPEAPESCDGVKEFVGWTEQSGYYHATTAPTDLFKTTTATVTADKTYYAVFATPPGTGGGGGGSETNTTLDFTAQGYANETAINKLTVDGVTATFDKGSNSNAPKYYTSGTAIRAYGGNTITLSANQITAATFTFGSSDGSNVITADCGSWDSPTWTGDATDEVVFTISGSSGNRRIKSIAVTYISGGGSGSYSDYTTICQQIESIEVQNPQTEFYLTDDFTIGSGKVIATLSGGGTTDVTALATFSGYNMNVVGTYTVTVTYMGATATYNINVKPLDNAWVLTWNVSGKTNTGLSPRSVTKGNAIGTLPVPEVPAACAGKTFMGWTTSNIVPSDGVGIEYITPETKPDDNTTYYAVFATVNNFCTQKPIDQITPSSKVVIVAVASLTDDGGAGKAISSRATDDTYNLQGDDVAIYDQTINTPHSTCIWTITKSDGKYIFTQDGKYLNAISDNGHYNLRYSNTQDTWTITNVDGMVNTYRMQSTVTNYFAEFFKGKFTLYKEANDQGEFDMQFFVTANAEGNADITDYTTGCAEYTITYYGFHGGYSTSCSSDGTIVLPVNSIHTIPDCEGLVINDHTNLGREFLNLWMTQPHGGHTFKPGDTFILTQDTTLYAQWKLNTQNDFTTLPTDVEDLAGTDVYVYGGKTLTLQPGTTTINSLTLKGGLQADGSYKMPTVWVPEGATLVRNSNKINLDLIVNAKTYYPFAVPFAAKNNENVEYLDPVLAAASTYGTHFAIKTYDGARRADVGEDKANNWVRVLRGETLQPGVGYIITALTYPAEDTATIRIPMTVPNTWFQNGEQAAVSTTVRNTIAVTTHAGAAATEHQRHAGWNFVANPYLTSFAGGNVANDGGLAYINGELIIEGSYEYGGEDVPYVTVPAYDFAYYSQHKLSDVKLSPEWSFFVQVGTGGTMNFTTAGRQQAPASIAARNAEERPVKMDVDLILSDNHSSDQTGLIICDRYSDAYEIGCDLEKLFGSAYNLSVYTLMEDNTPLAFQALAIRSSMQVIPVGYRAPEQGEYTFRLNEATSSIDLLNEQYEQLVLVDYQTGELTNLLYTDYTFYSERTQSNSRFAIYAVPRQNAPTDLPNAIGSDEEVRKVIYNDHLYILRDGNVYNGMGQKM